MASIVVFSLSSYLLNLAEFVLCPDIDNSPVFDDLRLSTLSANLLLQSFIPIVSFPTYFEPLYKFVYNLEQLCRDSLLANRDTKELVIQKARGSVSNHTLPPSDLNLIVSFISDSLESVLGVVNNEGFTLLLLHLIPYFQFPETSFEAICNFLNPLAQRMSKKNIERLFSAPVIYMFDSPTEPYQRGHLLSRPMADMLIKRFGLNTFLTRFLGYIIEAVIEPSRIASKGQHRKNSSSKAQHPSGSMLTLVQSDLMQSPRVEEFPSDYTFSLALSDVGTYDSDKDDSSSEESDIEDVPESSLLAKPRMVLSSLVGVSDTDFPEDAGTGRGESPTRGLKPWDHLFDQGSANKTTFDYSSPSAAVDTNSEQSEDSPLTSSVLLNYDTSMKLDTSLADYKPSPASPLTAGAGGAPSFGSSMTDSFHSAQSYSNEITNSFPPISSQPHFNTLSGIKRQSSLPVSRLRTLGISVDDILSTEQSESEDEEQTTTENLTSANPETLAINTHISQIAADCICWLVRRLGPILATRYIAKPLLESLYRCFSGILHPKGRGTAVLKCLSTIAKLYGEKVLLQLYLPHAENLVRGCLSSSYRKECSFDLQKKNFQNNEMKISLHVMST